MSYGGGGFRGGGMSYGGGEFRGGYGGTSSFGRSPATYSNRGFEGGREGSINYGARSGSYETPRGGTINAGAVERVCADPIACGVERVRCRRHDGRGRSFAEVGRVGGAVGPGGGVYHGENAFRPYGFNAYGGYHSGWVNGYWNGMNSGGVGLALALLGRDGVGHGHGPRFRHGHGARLGFVVVGLRLNAVWHGIYAV